MVFNKAVNMMNKQRELTSRNASRFSSGNTATVWVGIDVGSTTVKLAVIDPDSRNVLCWRYVRHNAAQAASLYNLLRLVSEIIPDVKYKVALCGSGAEPLVDVIGGAFVQEVIANSIAIKELYPHVQTAIELGGQDAKLMVFRPSDQGGASSLTDMRMNGNCAGGTGAFIDQMAVLLGISVEDFNELAAKGRNIHSISGRCGVFAKSDILPLVNLGIPKEDIALSVFHAVATQTICSLAQGLEIRTPIAFMGGPCSFNPVLVDAFLHKLNISGAAVIKPEFPQIIGAIGAALSIGELSDGLYKPYTGIQYLKSVKMPCGTNGDSNGKWFFATSQEYSSFVQRHEPPSFTAVYPQPETTLEAYIGIDAGSTTVKVVMIDTSGNLLNKWYVHNSGDTIEVARRVLVKIKDHYESRGIHLDIKGLGTTGYGEQLCAQAFGADYHTVETVAHAHAALKHFPDATFILDIGGQDMKAMKVENGVISEVYLNEACSSGCGSFIEATSQSLGIAVEKIAETAFKSDNPASLGSRCTVFMLSSVTTEQKNGKSREDIVAGLCRSVIENVFSKVIRMSDMKRLGKTIVVQGGMFKNDAVLRAFEQYVGIDVHRAPYSGEMGAYGIALLARQKSNGEKSMFIGFDTLHTLGYSKVTKEICTKCTNHCNRDIIKFSTGRAFCSGNRCEKGNVSSGQAARPENRGYQNRFTESMHKYKESLLFTDSEEIEKVLPENGITIGIPMAFEFWNSFPFWNALFKSLGFSVDVSGRSTALIAASGNRFASSDSICFPAKLMHGHIEALLEKKVTRIFAPAMKAITYRFKGVANMCPIVQGLPVFVDQLNRPYQRYGVIADTPAFSWDSLHLRNTQIKEFFSSTFGVSSSAAGKAIKIADRAHDSFTKKLYSRSTLQLNELEKTELFGVLIAGRPYHTDSYINHKTPEIFSSMGVPVFSSDSMPNLDRVDLSLVRPDFYNPFHTEVFSAAVFCAKHPRLEFVLLSSFGCGHDAVITDEVERIMGQIGAKRPLVLKIDDGECRGALSIRIRSFVETVKQKRSVQ